MGIARGKAFTQAISADEKVTFAKDPKLTEMTFGQVRDAVADAAPQQTVTVQLHWTEYVRGAWTERESGGVEPGSGTITVSGLSGFDPAEVFVHVSKEPADDGRERGVYVHLGGPINRGFYLAGRNSVPQEVRYGTDGPRPQNPYNGTAASGTRYHGFGPLTVEFKRRITTTDGGAPVDTVQTSAILGRGGAFSLLPCDDAVTLGAAGPDLATLAKPVFYQDAGATFFIEPSVSEQTIEDWQEWVTRTPQPDPGWHRPDWWDDLDLTPYVPVPVPGHAVPIDPRDPLWQAQADAQARFAVDPAPDWLVNAGTAVLFDGQVIDSEGRAGQPAVTGAAALTLVGGAGLGAAVHHIVQTTGNGG